MVTEKTVADSMRRQGLVARNVKRRRGLTKQDKTAPKFPDLVKRDFTATRPNLKWCGDITEIPTAYGKLYLATVIDLYSRRLLAAATSLRRGVGLRGDQDRGRGPRRAHSRTSSSTPTADRPTPPNASPGCVPSLGVRQSMGRVGSCFDNAAAEAFFSSLEWEVLSRHQFRPRPRRQVVLPWCYDFYNHPPTQQRPDADPHRLREPTPTTGRGRIEKSSTIRGESQRVPRIARVEASSSHVS